MNINFFGSTNLGCYILHPFFIFFGNMIWRQFSKFLDSKILEIKKEIDEAQKLHKDAKDLLTEETKETSGFRSCNKRNNR